MLDGFFKPNAVVVIGASREEGKVGFSIVDNLVKGSFSGPIYPVNPKATEIRGLRCYPDLTQVPDGAELAVLVIPPKVCIPTLEGGFRQPSEIHPLQRSTANSRTKPRLRQG